MPTILIKILLRRKLWVLGTSVLVTAVGAAVCLLAPKSYDAEIVLLSPDGTQSGLLDALRTNSYNTGLKGWVLVKAVHSRRLLLDLARHTYTVYDRGEPKKVFLVDPSKVSDDESVVRAAKRRVRVVVDRNNGAIRVTVRTRNPRLSHAVASRLLELLYKRIDRLRTDVREDRRQYYQPRLSEAHAVLESNTAEFATFAEKNRGWFNTDHPRVRLERDRLSRRVEASANIYRQLRADAEVSDVRAIAMVPTLEVLDPPRVPSIKSAPKRRLLALATLVLAAFAGVLAGLLADRFGVGSFSWLAVSGPGRQ